MSTVRKAVKANALDAELLNKYLSIGLQIDEDANKISKEDQAALKYIYKERVWKKAKTHKGGGRCSPMYE